MPNRVPLDVASVLERVGRSDLDLQVVTSTGSTNDDLLAAAASGASSWSVLVADLQTTGRGRNGRSWTSPPRAGLTFSVLLREAELVAAGLPRTRWSFLPLAAGLAVALALEDAGLYDVVSVKWPNDVLLSGRKFGGILCQSAGDAVVIGMGLNVDTTAEELPGPQATSLALEAPLLDVDRGGLLAFVLRHLRDVLAGDPAAVRREYLEYSATVGQDVRVTPVTGAPYTARAVDVDEQGALVLERDGRRITLLAGDVETLRPAAR